MSVHWQLECIDCGKATDWHQWNNHIHLKLMAICNARAIQSLAAAAQAFDMLPGVGSWALTLHEHPYPDALPIDLHYWTSCIGHRIWPRNEYGEWAPNCPWDIPGVVESEPMANARNPADPNKPKPAWMTAKEPKPKRVSRRGSEEFSGPEPKDDDDDPAPRTLSSSHGPVTITNLKEPIEGGETLN